MQNILRKQSALQIFLESLIYLYRLFFGEMPLPEYKPFVFVEPVGQIELLQNSARAFELKKCGGAAK